MPLSPPRDNSQRMRSPATYSLKHIAQTPTPAAPATVALERDIHWGTELARHVGRRLSVQALIIAHRQSSSPNTTLCEWSPSAGHIQGGRHRAQHRNGYSSARRSTDPVLSLGLNSIFPFSDMQPVVSEINSSKYLRMPDSVLSGLNLPFLNMDPNSTAESI